MQRDERVRYAPELGVWTIDMGELTAVTPGQEQHVLARAMFIAADAGAALDGCACAPEETHWDGPRLRTPVPPAAHEVARVGGVVVVGHGGRTAVAAMTGQEIQGRVCQLRNVDGEHRAKELTERGGQGLVELHALTQPYPIGAGPLEPLTPDADAPEAWGEGADGEPIRFSAEGFRVSSPGRHLHPEARSALMAYAELAGHVKELGMAAHAAEDAQRTAPRDLRRRVAQAAMSGKPTDAASAAQTLKGLEVQAQAARAVADGMGDALSARRAAVVAAVERNRADWLAYLSGHGRAALGRYQEALAALEAAAEELVLVDTVRANVMAPTGPGGQPFAQVSLLAGRSPVAAAHDFAAEAAQTLAPLGPHGRVEKGVSHA